MDSSYVENVLAEIEEEFQGIEEVDETPQTEKDDSPDKAIEDYDVVDSWEIGGVDDIHHSDVSYWRDKRRSRGSSYSRSEIKKYSSRDIKYDRTRKIPRRYLGKSSSKSGDSHFSLGSSRERILNDKDSVEHLRVSVRNSPLSDVKLPDLKCTTSVETGEINVVLLPDDTNADNSQDEREKSLSDGIRRRPPTLVKNPFACSTLRKKLSRSPDQVRQREYETSPKNSQERDIRETISRERQNRAKNSRERHGRERRSRETLSRERFSVEPLRERRGRERLSRERCSREPLNRERRSRERWSRERHGREPLRERHGKETRSRERSRRDSISRERIMRGCRDSRSYDFSNRERSLSPVRSRSNHRTSPYFYDRKIRRRSTSHSPERYFRKSRDYRKSRDSSRCRSRSREGSLSQVSTKSSLSLLSMRGGSPREHDRKKSPLRPYNFCDDPRQRDPNYFFTSDDFNNKLTLLLKERKQKQSEMYDDAGPSQASNYSNDAWKAYNWSSTGTSPYPPPPGINTNVSADSVYKSNVNPTDYTGYNQGSYNQVYYNNNQAQYSNAFTSNMGNFYQQSFSSPPPPLQGQYFPQPPVTMDFRANMYTGSQPGMQYENMNTSQQEPMLRNLVQLPSVAPPQDYNVANVVQHCSGMNTVPEMKIPSITSTVSKKRDIFSKSNESSSKTNKRIPTRTSIPLDTNKNHINEEDPMRTPPPPVISDTWKDIDFAEKSLWKGENKKWEVFSKCEQLLQKVMSNDPSMEPFKISRCKSVMPFTVKEETHLTSQSGIQDHQQTSQLDRFKSPLKKSTNPDLKWPWI